jgi:hypothetical protein
MIRLLVALYPRKWQAEFGDEFAALLEATRLTPRTVLDVIAMAGKLRVASRPRLALVIASLLWSGCMEYLSVRAGLTANIAWAPTTPARAIALAATIGPWLALAADAVPRRSRREERGAAPGGSAP